MARSLRGISMSISVESFVRSSGTAKTVDIENYVISSLSGTAKQAHGAIGYCRKMGWISIVRSIINNGRNEYIFRV